MIYLDNSATTRWKPDDVVDAVQQSLRCGANPGRSGHAAALAALANVLSAREKLCAFTDAKNGQCVFGSNCTQALNLAFFGALHCGHVVTTATEHNSVLRPLYALARSGKIRLTVLRPGPDGDVTPDQVQQAIAPDTVMVAVGAVSNVTGHAQSHLAAIGSLCRVRDLLFVVDGAQSVGYLPVSFRRCCIDLLAVAPHKGLHGPMGVGALIVGERVKLDPVLLGGTGVDSRNPVQLPVVPDGLEAGTLPYPAICGLAAAVDWAQTHRAEAEAVNTRLTEKLIRGLAERQIPVYSRANASGVVAFNLPGASSARVADELNRRGIYVRGGLHCAPLMHDYLGTSPDGAVRASVSVDNTEEEIDETLLALDEIKKTISL